MDLTKPEKKLLMEFLGRMSKHDIINLYKLKDRHDDLINKIYDQLKKEVENEAVRTKKRSDVRNQSASR